MARILGWLLSVTWRYVAAFALLFAAWLGFVAASGALKTVRADLERIDEQRAEVAQLEQALSEGSARVSAYADARRVAAEALEGLDTQQQALADRAARLRSEAAEQGARVEAMAEQAASEARRETARWQTQVDEACDTRFWQVARRAACDLARQQRDAAMERLRETQAAALRARSEARARVDEMRAEAQAADEALDALLSEQAALARERAQAAAELARAQAEHERLQGLRGQAATELARLQELEDSAAGFVVREFERMAWRLGGFLLLAFLTPYIYRTIVYYAVMRGVERARPVQLVPAESSGALHANRADRTLRVTLAHGEALWARERCVRPVVPGAASTQVMYDWRSPLVSIAAGLFLLTRVRAREDGAAEVRATLSPTGRGAADRYVLEVRLEEHPGLVIHPKHLIALRGDIQIRRRWALGSLHAWATGQLRYVMLSGSGAIYLEGVGDVVAEDLHGESKQETHDSIVAFDGRLAYATRRTETFLPYLLGLKPLVEVGLQGEGCFVWQKTAEGEQSTFLEKTFGAFWSALGKVLGF